jgi:hypothetical protein
MLATCVGRGPGNKMQRIDAVRIFVAPAINDGSINRHIDADLRFVSNGQGARVRQQSASVT